MLNEILSKEYIIKNGVEFEEYLGYGGPYELGIVEYSEEGEEKLYTGLAYDLYENGNVESYLFVKEGVKQGRIVSFYPNGNVKSIGNMNKGAAEGYQVEYFENNVKKYESECCAGREMTFTKYDENGNIIAQKMKPNESDILYATKFK